MSYTNPVIEKIRAENRKKTAVLVAEAERIRDEIRARINSIKDPVMKACLIKQLDR